MARLNKAQKENRDEKKTAVTAQIAADAQTTIDSPTVSKIEAPPTPISSALSTNQPITLASAPIAIPDTNGPTVVTPRRSPSIASEAGAGAPSVSNFSVIAAATNVAAASGSKSPLGGPPSDMSTSDSDNEEAGKDKSIANDAGPDDGEIEEEDELGGGASNGVSPEVRCMWEDCGKVFTTLAPFISHLHEDHVGIHKAKYACEWTGCPRKGKMQTSRFALLSHLRSHTGEKPFTCPRPECDKSFTRSDALAKHMRVQHNINPVSNRGRGSKGGGAKNASVAADATDSVNNSGGRSSRVRATGEDDESELLGEESVDVLGDELVELAEGDGNRSLADIESSLAFQGAMGYAFTYDNLFGQGASALADYTGASNYTESDLGIVRDIAPPSGPLVDDDMPDEVELKKEEDEMIRVLENGRHMWIEREKEKAKLRIVDEENSGEKRGGADYDSDDLMVKEEESSFKRSRRSHGAASIRLDSPATSVSAGRISGRSSEMAMEGNRLKKLYLIEKAKLRVVQSENKKMRLYLDHLRGMEREEKLGKRQALERALEAELGRDVAAIFSPPPSPPPS